MSIPTLENLRIENSEEEEEEEEEEVDEEEDEGACFYSEEKSAERERKLEIELSDTMKMWLESDFERITLHNKLLKIPSKPNIISILEDYFKTWATEHLFQISEKPKRKFNFRQKKNEMHDIDSAIRIVRICREVMDGIRISFDFTLPALLLYNQEREQFNKLDLSQKGEEEPDLPNGNNTEFTAEDNTENGYGEPSSMLHIDIIPEEDREENPEGEKAEEEEEIEEQEEGGKEEQEETPIEEFSPDIQESLPSDESTDTEFNLTMLTSEPNLSVVSIEANEVNGYLIVGSADDSTEPEYLEITPIITQNGLMNDDDDDDDCDRDNDNDSEISPQEENCVLESCVQENKVSCAPLLITQDNSESKQNNTKRTLLPEFLTGVPRIVTRSMTTNAHSRRKDEMAKAYAILSSLLEKPFAPQTQDPILPSCVYGPIHLARLFVKLPNILQASYASSRKLSTLSQHLHMFLNYLEGHPQWFSEENYIDNKSPNVKEKEPN